MPSIDEAISLIYEICQNHPEICPHRWQVKIKECLKRDSKTLTTHYRCPLCGSEHKETKELTDSELALQKRLIELEDEAKKKYTIGKKYVFEHFRENKVGVLLKIDYFNGPWIFKYDCGFDLYSGKHEEQIEYSDELIEEVKEK